jgi:hypothetical protein
MKAAANSLIVTGVFAFFGGLAFWLVPHIPGCATVPVTGPDPTPVRQGSLLRRQQ